MLVPQMAILLQGLVDDVFQLDGKIRIQPDGRDRRPIHDPVVNYSRTLATEWQFTRRHLVEDYTERKQIRARIEFPRPHLLWRHIRNCSNRGSRASEMLRIHVVIQPLCCRCFPRSAASRP